MYDLIVVFIAFVLFYFIFCVGLKVHLGSSQGPFKFCSSRPIGQLTRPSPLSSFSRTKAHLRAAHCSWLHSFDKTCLLSRQLKASSHPSYSLFSSVPRAYSPMHHMSPPAPSTKPRQTLTVARHTDPSSHAYPAPLHVSCHHAAMQITHPPDDDCVESGYTPSYPSSLHGALLTSLGPQQLVSSLEAFPRASHTLYLCLDAAPYTSLYSQLHGSS